jgi:hypothetical protein
MVGSGVNRTLEVDETFTLETMVCKSVCLMQKPSQRVFLLVKHGRRVWDPSSVLALQRAAHLLLRVANIDGDAGVTPGREERGSSVIHPSDLSLLTTSEGGGRRWVGYLGKATMRNY